MQPERDIRTICVPNAEMPVWISQHKSSAGGIQARAGRLAENWHSWHICHRQRHLLRESTADSKTSMRVVPCDPPRTVSFPLVGLREYMYSLPYALKFDAF